MLASDVRLDQEFRDEIQLQMGCCREAANWLTDVLWRRSPERTFWTVALAHYRAHAVQRVMTRQFREGTFWLSVQTLYRAEKLLKERYG